MPITRQQELAVMNILPGNMGRTLIAMINSFGGGGVIPGAGPILPSVINTTPPIYTAAADYTETIGGVVTTHLDIASVKDFWEVKMGLLPKHVHALRGEGITHPIDLSLFTSEEFNSVIRSMKSKVALPGIAQIRLKDVCDFFQYIVTTNRRMKNQYLTYDSIQSHKVQFAALKENKEVGGLPKLTEEVDLLSWVDTARKSLESLLGQDGFPLGYLTCDDIAVPAITDELIPGKCFSVLHKSLVGEMIARKDHNGPTVDTDKVLLYSLLYKALMGGIYEACLEPHEDTKDGLAVMNSIIDQHGGSAIWEKAHTSRTAALDQEWKSANANRSLSTHISHLRNKYVDLKRCCSHLNRTPPTEREMVLKLMSSINTTHPLLTAHMSAVNADIVGLGSNFERCAAHLMLADPIETKPVSAGRKRVSISGLAGRGDETQVDLRWHEPEEFKQLTKAQKAELTRWRKTEEGHASIAKSLKKFKAEKIAANKKRKSSDISGGATKRGRTGDGDYKDVSNTSEGKRYTKKEYAKAVKVAAVKMAAEAANAEKASIAAADASLEQAIKRHEAKTGASISSASVAPPVPVEGAEAEEEHTRKQTALKLGSVLKSNSAVTLSAVKSRIKSLKDVSFDDGK